MKTEQLFLELEKNKIEYTPDFCVKSKSTFRIGGSCAAALFPKGRGELILSVKLLDGMGLPFLVIGRGSNVLFSDAYIDKVLIFTNDVCKVDIDGESVYAEAGASLVGLCRTVAEHGLSGMEFACGIPASVGGAVYMNAGAHGSAVGNIIEYTEAYDREVGSILRIYDNSFDYRESIYEKTRDLVCLGASFKLSFGDTEAIKAKMAEFLEKRKNAQPLEYPSAGSYFKRPEGDFAGRLIELCKLKGIRVGDAEVSEKHAGFIINRGNASFDDVMKLEKLVKEEVFKKCNVELCREVEVIE